MKALRNSTIAGALAGALLVLSAPLSLAQDITIRYASPNPESDPTQEAVSWFANQVTERTSGRVKFEMFLGASLVQDQDVLAAVGEGLVDMAKIFTISYPGELPVLNIANLPFTNPSPYVMINTVHGLMEKFPEFDKEMEALNVHHLGVFATGGTGLISKKPINTVEDLKGLQMRTRGVQAMAFTAVGSIPVAVPWAEVYEALSKGVVDATTNYLVVVKSVRHNEVGDYYTAVGLGQAVQAEIVNRDFWASLPDDIKQIMTETMAEAEQRYAEIASQLAVSETEFFNNAPGAEHLAVSTFPAEERQKWIGMSPDFMADWAQQNAGKGDTQAIVAAFKALEEEYAAKGAALNLIDMW